MRSGEIQASKLVAGPFFSLPSSLPPFLPSFLSFLLPVDSRRQQQVEGEGGMLMPVAIIEMLHLCHGRGQNETGTLTELGTEVTRGNEYASTRFSSDV